VVLGFREARIIFFPVGDWLIAVGFIVQEDPVLLTSEDRTQKPYVAILKVYDQIRDSAILMLFHYFYSICL